jgi:hypothetical protein
MTGCAVQTTQPLSDPGTAKPDESLYGHWVETKKVMDKTRELHVFVGKHTTKKNPGAIMEAVLVDWDVEAKRVKGEDPLYFTLTHIGKASYMNLIGDKPGRGFNLKEEGSYEKWTKSENRRCTIVRYSCDGKQLRIWTTTQADKLGKMRDLRVADGILDSDRFAVYLRDKGGEGVFDELYMTLDKVR